MQTIATPNASGRQLDRALAWITNLRKESFIAAAAVNSAGDASPVIIASTIDSIGVTRSPDLGNLKQLGEDVSKQLEFVPVSFRVIRHVRPRRACSRTTRNGNPVCDRVA